MILNFINRIISFLLAPHLYIRFGIAGTDIDKHAEKYDVSSSTCNVSDVSPETFDRLVYFMQNTHVSKGIVKSPGPLKELQIVGYNGRLFGDVWYSQYMIVAYVKYVKYNTQWMYELVFSTTYDSLVDGTYTWRFSYDVATRTANVSYIKKYRFHPLVRWWVTIFYTKQKVKEQNDAFVEEDIQFFSKMLHT